jgi:hypothetical protein
MADINAGALEVMNIPMYNHIQEYFTAGDELRLEMWGCMEETVQLQFRK